MIGNQKLKTHGKQFNFEVQLFFFFTNDSENKVRKKEIEIETANCGSVAIQQEIGESLDNTGKELVLDIRWSSWQEQRGKLRFTQGKYMTVNLIT